MKLAKFLPIIFSCLFGGSLLWAQDPLDFFPHHLGDVWEYWLEQYPGSYIITQNEITKDSLGNDGRYYVETTRFGKFVIDTTTFEVFQSYGTLDKLYRLDADSGEAWIVWEDSSGQHQGIAVVYDVFQDILFGQSVSVKVINYYAVNIALSESLWTSTDYLASDFGLVRRDVEFSAPYYFIRGAIIDSVLYGNVTSIEEAEKYGLPGWFTLHQNYPNPFNPYTTIEYQLSRAAPVTLQIFNSLGQRVATLVNELQLPGNYQIRFDGSNLSSGEYYYRIEANGFLQHKKMLLVK